MSDKPTDDQPAVPSIGQTTEKSATTEKPQPETAKDREGQTREQGYDEA